MSANSLVGPVYLDWEQRLEQRLDLIHFALKQGDSKILAAIFAQDQSSPIDHHATFNVQARNLGPHVSENGSRILRDLEDHVLKTNEHIRSDNNRIDKNMEELARSDKRNDQDAWHRNIQENINSLRNTSRQQVEQLRSYGRQKIEHLPEQLRQPAVDIFNGAVGVVFTFVNTTQQYLQDASNTIPTWIRQPQDKVQEFRRAYKYWYEGSEIMIKGWFKGARHLRGVPSMNDGAPDGDNIGAIRDIATKLQCIGLESFTIVRKGSGWALEISEE
ncbi:hypothetical protein BFW01_g10278 [Lasiodiplodia theobromae]|uniref:Uncharacterized protein n=2 Tax=Lasiodiplodia TaxID=66739 RepID=A0A5N5D4L8_9PEZI|nr:uncharacterized protein LTHEOB_10976 [Lasiodiplodia theobromae]KAB2572678.1 hypothetical protein DBV05_g8633 [Lasiodiplodia theobromae]KAF4538206.1 hypothetical protein LTHEOB_10976 [Lasiodiplodia theobromae]KAF9629075.1 hypothetical protein BFW01_g10278 [Lasiodiplodia theobromae]KAK0653637.1 hypothetical protein DIS24_g5872 [Lasiodiplodia hormozganensis]